MNKQFFEELEKRFTEASNPVQAVAMKAYMKNQFEFLGIKAAERQLIVKEVCKMFPIKDWETADALKFYLWDREEREYQYAYIQMLRSCTGIWPEKAHKLFEETVLHKSWWDTVDYINADLIGPFFIKYPENMLSITDDWNKSTNMWLQRTSIIFQLKYKKDTNLRMLSEYIWHTKESKEFFVRKAIGWALREYGKTNPGWVTEFCEKYELSPLSKREALRIILSKRNPK